MRDLKKEAFAFWNGLTVAQKTIILFFFATALLALIVMIPNPPRVIVTFPKLNASPLKTFPVPKITVRPHHSNLIQKGLCYSIFKFNLTNKSYDGIRCSRMNGICVCVEEV